MPKPFHPLVSTTRTPTRAGAGGPPGAPQDHERAARGQPARRPGRAPARGLRPAGLRRRARAALPVGLRHPGLHGRGADVAQPLAVSPDVPRGRRRAVRRRRRAAVHRRVRGRVDGVRRQPVRRLARHRAATTPTSATRSCRSSTTATARWRRRAPRHRRQVQRRLRGHDHADAAPGPLRRAGQPRRRRALRALLHPGLRQGRPRAARLRRLLRAVLGGLRVAPADEQADRRRPRHDLRRRGSVLGRRGRHRAPPVRPAHGPARRRRLGALAGLGPGAHGARATPTRCAACARSTSTAAPATSGTSSSARSPSATRSPRSASRTSRASSSTRRTAASTTATRAAWRTSRSGSPPQRDGMPKPALEFFPVGSLDWTAVSPGVWGARPRPRRRWRRPDPHPALGPRTRHVAPWPGRARLRRRGADPVRLDARSDTRRDVRGRRLCLPAARSGRRPVGERPRAARCSRCATRRRRAACRSGSSASRFHR